MGVWTSSSRQDPCPLCGRNKDDKCRRSQSVIHCYQGSSFSPPVELKLGQTLEIDGQTWAVVSLQGGFSGAHAVLRPHVGWTDVRPAVRQAQRRQVATLEPVLLELYQQVRTWVQAAMGVQELQYLTLQEIREAWEIVSTAADALAELRPPLRAARRERPELARLDEAVQLWSKSIGYQQADLKQFWRRDLGISAEATR